MENQMNNMLNCLRHPGPETVSPDFSRPPPNFKPNYGKSNPFGGNPALLQYRFPMPMPKPLPMVAPPLVPPLPPPALLPGTPAAIPLPLRPMDSNRHDISKPPQASVVVPPAQRSDADLLMAYAPPPKPESVSEEESVSGNSRTSAPKLSLPRLGKEEAKKRLKAFSAKSVLSASKFKVGKESEEKPTEEQKQPSVEAGAIDDKKDASVKKKKKIAEKSAIEQIIEEDKKIKEALGLSHPFLDYENSSYFPFRNFCDEETINKLVEKSKSLREKIKDENSVENMLLERQKKKKHKRSHSRDGSRSPRKQRPSSSTKRRSSHSRSHHKPTKEKKKEIPKNWKEFKNNGLSFDEVKEMNSKRLESFRRERLERSSSRSGHHDDSHKSNSIKFDSSVSLSFSVVPVNSVKDANVMYYPGSLAKLTRHDPAVTYCRKHYKSDYLQREDYTKRESSKVFKVMEDVWKGKEYLKENFVKRTSDCRLWYSEAFLVPIDISEGVTELYNVKSKWDNDELDAETKLEKYKPASSEAPELKVKVEPVTENTEAVQSSPKHEDQEVQEDKKEDIVNDFTQNTLSKEYDAFMQIVEHSSEDADRKIELIPPADMVESPRASEVEAPEDTYEMKKLKKQKKAEAKAERKLQKKLKKERKKELKRIQKAMKKKKKKLRKKEKHSKKDKDRGKESDRSDDEHINDSDDDDDDQAVDDLRSSGSEDNIQDHSPVHSRENEQYHSITHSDNEGGSKPEDSANDDQSSYELYDDLEIEDTKVNACLPSECEQSAQTYTKIEESPVSGKHAESSEGDAGDSESQCGSGVAGEERQLPEEAEDSCNDSEVCQSAQDSSDEEERKAYDDDSDVTEKHELKEAHAERYSPSNVSASSSPRDDTGSSPRDVFQEDTPKLPSPYSPQSGSPYCGSSSEDEGNTSEKKVAHSSFKGCLLEVEGSPIRPVTVVEIDQHSGHQNVSGQVSTDSNSDDCLESTSSNIPPPVSLPTDVSEDKPESMITAVINHLPACGAVPKPVPPPSFFPIISQSKILQGICKPRSSDNTNQPTSTSTDEAVMKGSEILQVASAVNDSWGGGSSHHSATLHPSPLSKTSVSSPSMDSERSEFPELAALTSNLIQIPLLSQPSVQIPNVDILPPLQKPVKESYIELGSIQIPLPPQPPPIGPPQPTSLSDNISQPLPSRLPSSLKVGPLLPPPPPPNLSAPAQVPKDSGPAKPSTDEQLDPVVTKSTKKELPAAFELATLDKSATPSETTEKSETSSKSESKPVTFKLGLKKQNLNLHLKRTSAIGFLGDEEDEATEQPRRFLPLLKDPELISKRSAEEAKKKTSSSDEKVSATSTDDKKDSGNVESISSGINKDSQCKLNERSLDGSSVSVTADVSRNAQLKEKTDLPVSDPPSSVRMDSVEKHYAEAPDSKASSAQSPRRSREQRKSPKRSPRRSRSPHRSRSPSSRKRSWSRSPVRRRSPRRSRSPGRRKSPPRRRSPGRRKLSPRSRSSRSPRRKSPSRKGSARRSSISPKKRSPSDRSPGRTRSPKYKSHRRDSPSKYESRSSISPVRKEKSLQRSSLDQESDIGGRKREKSYSPDRRFSRSPEKRCKPSASFRRYDCDKSPSPHRSEQCSPVREKWQKQSTSPLPSMKYDDSNYRKESYSPRGSAPKVNDNVAVDREGTRISATVDSSDADGSVVGNKISTISSVFPGRDESSWSWEEGGAWNESESCNIVPSHEMGYVSGSSFTQRTLADGHFKEHGMDVGPQSDALYGSSYKWDESSYNYTSSSNQKKGTSQVIQVGNVLQVLPQDMSPAKNPELTQSVPVPDDAQKAAVIVEKKPEAEQLAVPPEIVLQPKETSVTSPHSVTETRTVVAVPTPVPPPVPSPVPKPVPPVTLMPASVKPIKISIPSLEKEKKMVPPPPQPPALAENMSEQEQAKTEDAQLLGESTDASVPKVQGILETLPAALLAAMDPQQQHAILSAAAVAAAAASSGMYPNTLPVAQLLSILQQQSVNTPPLLTESLEKIALSQEADALKKARKAKKEKKRLEREARRRAREEQARKKEEDQTESDIEEELIKEAISEVPELGSPVPDYALEEEEEDDDEGESAKKKHIIALPPAEKGILLSPTYKSRDSCQSKSVSFADGVMPGYGTSPSGGEEIHSPPPPSARNKKREKKLKKKRKTKLRVIKLFSEVGSANGMLSPPPPPATPSSGSSAFKLYPGCMHYTYTPPGTVIIYTQESTPDPEPLPPSLASLLAQVGLPSANAMGNGMPECPTASSLFPAVSEPSSLAPFVGVPLAQ